MKHICLTSLFLIFLLAGPHSAAASVVGDPTCAMDVQIAHQEKGLMTGTLTNVRALGFAGGFLGGDFCDRFNGTAVRITGQGNYAELMMERAQSLTLGVQQGSTMGAEGPVTFLHWNIIAMREGDKDVAPDVYPAISVTLQDE